MADRLTVFISSTARDLQKYRVKVKEAVLWAGAHPVAMEEFDATTRNALQLCYDEVVKAEALVGIYAHRYGFAPDSGMTYTTTDGQTRAGDGQTGITEWEYRWAMERGIPVLPYYRFVHDTLRQYLASARFVADEGEKVSNPPADEALKIKIQGCRSVSTYAPVVRIASYDQARVAVKIPPK